MNKSMASVIRREQLILKIEKDFPELVKGVKMAADVVLLHQDAFAADYQYDEYLLLGMIIKYCGLKGKEVRIVGENGETIT